MVANTDDSSEPGTHWISIYSPNRRYVRYFDSLDGKEEPNIHIFLEKNWTHVDRQRYKIQSPTSDVCGYYAIYFVYMSCLNYPFRVIEKLLLNQSNPDSFVVKFVNAKIK